MKAFSFKVFSEGVGFKNYNELKFYGIPEICFTGRSNVGKSSLINAITNRKSLASTSNKPGHTRKIFFYNIAKKFMLVDLPGYGYAKASKNKIEKMSELVFLYLTKRTYLKMVYILIDSRHGFKESDISFLEFLDTNKISFQIVFTKIDKINESEKEILIKGMQFHKLIKNSHPFYTSSKTKLGVKDIKKQIIDNFKNYE
ncbi:MAG: YihA family ribosome biogenesis GTP-binding protein [Alphaproteobacteria bacterium TMED194]|nr:MAG: YihA family ribosome biogenesis GTP-binding protein [Alphaproteobacteria bacterium TMED194]